MKRIVSLLLATVIVLTPVFSFAIDWETLLESMTKSELLELQSKLEAALNADVQQEQSNVKTYEVAGVTFNNSNGTSRQQILADLLTVYGKGTDIPCRVVEYDYYGDPAFYVYVGTKIIGNIPADDVAEVKSLLPEIDDIYVRIGKFEPAGETIYYAKVTIVCPSATSTPKPFRVHNGQTIIYGDYEGTCPFTVKAGNDSNYYIYLEYQYAPSNSTTPRELKRYASKPYKGDIAFYLEKGKSYKIEVPVGVYKLFYATGDTFYGRQLRFGDETRCYTSDELLDFYCDGEYYNGHTITLYAVTDGNFDTDEIPESSFPE